jgi:cytochrome c6
MAQGIFRKMRTGQSQGVKKEDAMKVLLSIVSILVAVHFLSITTPANGADKNPSGAELFKTHCAVCHPDGGNIINPGKTLRKADREKNKVEKPDDILSRMRDPGPGMTKFDNATISDQDAKKIVEYILKTFK